MIFGAFPLPRVIIASHESCEGIPASLRKDAQAYRVVGVDLVAHKVPLAGDLFCAAEPGKNGGSEAVSVRLAQRGVAVEGTDHLNTAESNEIIDPYVEALLRVKDLVLAVVAARVYTRLVVAREERVQTGTEDVDRRGIDDANCPRDAACFGFRGAILERRIVGERAWLEGGGGRWNGLEVRGLGLDEAHDDVLGTGQLILIQHAVLDRSAPEPRRALALDEHASTDVNVHLGLVRRIKVVVSRPHPHVFEICRGLGGQVQHQGCGNAFLVDLARQFGAVLDGEVGASRAADTEMGVWEEYIHVSLLRLKFWTSHLGQVILDK